MHRHHHGYTWLGSGFELHRDGPRREVHPAFGSSPLPPLEVAQWLLKAGALVQGTWEAPEPAAQWYASQVRPHAADFADAHERAVLAARLSGVGARIAEGQDVVGGWWLAGRRFLSVCLVACSPHPVRTAYTCPVG
ncbi:hypothetical protein AB0M39_34005 [Streptomyces sp. NPDC051907]|uniref:hypothetical protein n=1 Tax=Streptomyces sp. NPDC051907 TaxID=3155284 RepID=UPI00341DEBA9